MEDVEAASLEPPMRQPLLDPDAMASALEERLSSLSRSANQASPGEAQVVASPSPSAPPEPAICKPKAGTESACHEPDQCNAPAVEAELAALDIT